MKILIFGAGAIGSLFGARLSVHNDVTLLSRKEHVEKIRNNGLVIKGKTKGVYHPTAISTLDEYEGKPDLVIVTVKSYDTERAVGDIVDKFGVEIPVMSLQNGLDNLEKMRRYLTEDKILLALTTEACTFLKPGEVEHTGTGKTLVGSLQRSDIVGRICTEFRKAGFRTMVSRNIIRDMWKKAIVNACINPLTAILEVKNGFLMDDVLGSIVEDICQECIDVARSAGVEMDFNEMIKEVTSVIESTSENLSSMLQSILKGKKTEIDSINGYICKLGRRYGKDIKLNNTLVNLVKMREGFR